MASISSNQEAGNRSLGPVLLSISTAVLAAERRSFSGMSPPEERVKLMEFFRNNAARQQQAGQSA
jgi:hypothetical protein